MSQRPLVCVLQGSFELIAQVAPKAVARILEGMARRMSPGAAPNDRCAFASGVFSNAVCRAPCAGFAVSAGLVSDVAHCDELT